MRCGAVRPQHSGRHVSRDMGGGPISQTVDKTKGLEQSLRRGAAGEGARRAARGTGRGRRAAFAFKFARKRADFPLLMRREEH